MFTTICIEHGAPIRVTTTPLDDGRQFIVLRCGSLSVYLPGVDGEGAIYARELAAALLSAAETIQPLESRPPAAPVM